MKCVFSSLFLLCILSTTAQQRSYDTTTINLFEDIEAVQGAYMLADHISFYANYYMEDVDSVTVHDTAHAQFKIQGENFYMMIDSVESIQNDRYYATIYHEYKILAVQRPVSLPKQILAVDVKDSVFQQMGMSGMTSTDSSGFRRITIHFDAEAIYTNYEILFDLSNYRIKEIRYSLKKELEVESTKRINMVITFGGHKTEDFADSVFNTDSLFRVKNSVDIDRGVSLPSDYQIISLINDVP
jgi:hypothetical protein